MRVVGHSDCEYNTKKQNGYIIISHAACQVAWDITKCPVQPVRLHGTSQHIPCSLSHGIRYHIILHAACKAGAGVCAAAAAVAAELLGVSLELLGTSLELLGVSFELLGAFIGLLEAAFELLGTPP